VNTRIERVLSAETKGHFRCTMVRALYSLFLGGLNTFGKS
jgi:hypothetical protein